MENALDTRHTLDERKLHSRYYTASLIREAVDCQILSADEVNRIQSDLFSLLSVQWDRRSHGESSSVPVETAQEMMTSLLFVIGLALKSYASSERAVSALQTVPLAELFEEGLKVAQRNVAAARRLQKTIANNLLKTPNVYYRSTIVDGIRGFFRLYQPQFEAHEVHITADYPVLAGRPEADGIEFIDTYLRCLDAENAFCVRFRSGDIHRLLCGLTPEYQNIPMNIFEYVILSAMGLVLVNRSPRNLNLTDDDVKKLCRLFFDKTDEEIRGLLHGTVQMLYRCGLMPSSTRSYLGVTMKQLASDVKNAMETDTMERIFLVPYDSWRKADISFTSGERMDDRAYQALVDRLFRIENREEKIALIFREVHSLEDLLDLLSDAELDEEDLEQLVEGLPLSVFTVLLSQYPNDDFLVRESEQKLYQALSRRRERLSPGEKEQVKRAEKAFLFH